jgi:hypothetical protein
MTDHEMWDYGVAAVRKEYTALSPSLKARLNEYTKAIKSCKQNLHLIGSGARAAEICAQCRGECCKGGKSHVTVVDLLVYLAEDKELFIPSFEWEICPYLVESGCLMGPQYRPYNCITFICDRVEGLLDVEERECLYAVERELRSLYEALERLFDNSFRYGFLNSSERYLARNRAPILRGAALNEEWDTRQETEMHKNTSNVSGG